MNITTQQMIMRVCYADASGLWRWKIWSHILCLSYIVASVDQKEKAGGRTA